MKCLQVIVLFIILVLCFFELYRIQKKEAKKMREFLHDMEKPNGSVKEWLSARSKQ